jgi:gluconolactonase
MRERSLLRPFACVALVAVTSTIATMSWAQAPAPPAVAPAPPPLPQMPPSLVPAQVVDLMTADGSAVFGAQWRTIEAKIVEVPAIANAMPEHKTTYDIRPHAGEAGFDDSSWPVIDATGLAARRGGGKVSFIWYRTMLTMPAKIGNFETTDAKAVLTAYVDDYAEVWINGQMPRRSGYPSPATIQGLNMPNRVVLAEAIKPGEKFQVAVFGINGPISVAPENFVWFRAAKIEFFR